MIKFMAIAFALVPITAFAQSDEWFLMSREGECVEVKTLARKVPNLGNVNDPAAFVELMKKQGYKTAPVSLPGFDDNMVQVDVPQKRLYLIFVKKSLCKEFLRGPSKSSDSSIPSETPQIKPEEKGK